jgi:hypothetical protein
MLNNKPQGQQQRINVCDSLFLVQNNALLPIQEKALPKSTKLTN